MNIRVQKENIKRRLELLTIEEVMNLFKLKESNIRKAIFKREIPYIKIGGLIRFKTEDLIDYIQTLRVEKK